MEGKILNFGEILLRFSPDLTQPWLESNRLPFYVGGAELNVASALALWGLPSAYISAMPQNEISTGILAYLRRKNMEVDSMLMQGDRLGLYYLPKGKDLKNAAVIYDRAGSSFAALRRTDIDWDKVFDGVSWFNFSAICPAINQELAAICLEAVQEASRRNIFVSLDLNYRSKLWKYGKHPLVVMPEIARYCDLIMGNVWAAMQMLGVSLHPDLQLPKSEYPRELLLQQAEDTGRELVARFDKCRYVANTFRFDYQESGVRYFTTLFNHDRTLLSTEYLETEIVDKVGSGDCYMAGLLYGIYKGMDLTETLEFATAAAVDKLFVLGDATDSLVSDILKRKNNEQKR